MRPFNRTEVENGISALYENYYYPGDELVATDLYEIVQIILTEFIEGREGEDEAPTV